MTALPLVIDTNLLVLYVVGSTSRDYIAKHKRLTNFTDIDYDLLLHTIKKASKILVTPNILTETSNLAAQIAEPARSRILGFLKLMIESTEERYHESRVAVGHSEFVRLGLTDVVLLEAISEHAVLLTTDLNLYLVAINRGLNAFNFNHIRDSYL